MSQANTTKPPELVRALKLRDLVLFNLVAVLGLRHLATSAEFGPGVLLIWALAALCFFVPQGLAVSELSARLPGEGGIYHWTKQALGEGHAFLCGWCYWIVNVLYFPYLLISTAVIALYVVGLGDSNLKDRWSYVLPATLIAFWLAVALNIVGVGTGKWLQNVGGLGTYIPGLVLISLGVYGMITMPGAHSFNAETLNPDFSQLPTLNLLATVAFAFAGLELAATMGDEVENPRRNLPRAVLIAAPLIALAYILGTTAVLWLVPQAQLNRVAGFLQAIENGARHLSPSLWWLGPLCAALYTVGNLGMVGAWLTGPARVAFVVGIDRYFPAAFGKIHPTWHTPYVAILAQAILATSFLLFSVVGKGTAVEEVYLILLDTQILIYFIPFIYLFIVFLLHRLRANEASQAKSEIALAPGGRAGAWLISLSGLAVTIFAMIVALIPPPGTANSWLFRLKVIGGALGFISIGGAIYLAAKLRMRK
jgi:glutamate:GABA antiporter